MSSLAALAHAGHVRSAPFNGLFYATAATIIPVLYLALAVQGNLYTDLLKAGSGADPRVFRRRFREDPRGPLRVIIGQIFRLAAAGIAVGIPIFGTLGEIQALITLYRGHTVGLPLVVLAAVVFLTAAAAGKAGPGRRKICIPLGEGPRPR